MDDNEWETINPSSSDSDDSDAVIHTTHTNFTHPDDHYQHPPQQPPSSTTNPHEIVDPELPQPPEVTKLGVLSSWVRSNRIGVWSVIATVGVFFTATVYARRRRRRRMLEKGDKEKMLVLLNQKDEKIRQLLIQIDRLNAMLSARRRVPVIRVMVDSPVVIGPRLN